jgi:hypothetical protein
MAQGSNDRPKPAATAHMIASASFIVTHEIPEVWRAASHRACGRADMLIS